MARPARCAAPDKTITIMQDLKKILAALLSIVTIAAIPVFELEPATAEAHMLSSKQERSIGDKIYRKHTKDHYIEVPSETDIVSIAQKRLVECNPDRLNMNDGKHKRWLYPTVIDRSETYPNAYMYPGGRSVIFYTNVDIETIYDKHDNFRDDDYRPTSADYYTSNSNVAAVLAHEYGHWANADFLRSADRHMGIAVALSCIPIPVGAVVGAHIATAGGNVLLNRQESFNAEAGADQAALELLANVPEYSMGSFISSFTRYKKYLKSNNMTDKTTNFKDFVAAHSHNDTRMQRACDYMKKISNGRVELDINSRLKVDGKPVGIDGLLMDTKLADGKERTAFIAGQIATCIQKGIWDHHHLVITRESDYLPDNGSYWRTVLFACETPGRDHGSGRIIKVLGTFDCDIDSINSNGRLSKDKQRAVDELRSIWNMADSDSRIAGSRHSSTGGD